MFKLEASKYDLLASKARDIHLRLNDAIYFMCIGVCYLIHQAVPGLVIQYLPFL